MSGWHADGGRKLTANGLLEVVRVDCGEGPIQLRGCEMQWLTKCAQEHGSGIDFEIEMKCQHSSQLILSF